MSYRNYISCISWEDRFIKSFYSDYETYKFHKAILFYFKDERFFELSQSNLDLVIAFANEKNINIELCEMVFHNQVEIFQKADEALRQSSQQSNYLNITTMPRHLLYIVLNILYKHNNIFDIFYYVPEKYGNEIAKNPEVPQLLLKHSGIFESDKETLLIISAGLDKERIFQLYYYFEPKKTIIIEEKEGYANIVEEDRINFREGLEELNCDFYIRDSFTENNITSFLQNNLAEEIEQYNTLLCSIGPKIASLEFFKYNLKNPKCGIVFALSKEYSKDYSFGLDSRNIFIRTSKFFDD